MLRFGNTQWLGLAPSPTIFSYESPCSSDQLLRTIQLWHRPDRDAKKIFRGCKNKACTRRQLALRLEDVGETRAAIEPRTVNGQMELEDEFDNYMRSVAASVPQYSTQYRESRRAFIAGARRLYIYMTQGVVQLSDDDAEKELQRLDREMCAYWKLACDDKD